MKGLFIRIDPTLDRELTELCRHEGYKKSGVIQKLIRDFLQRKRSSQDSVRAAAEFGIDTTLLSQNLQKTPTQRLPHN